MKKLFIITLGLLTTTALVYGGGGTGTCTKKASVKTTSAEITTASIEGKTCTHAGIKTAAVTDKTASAATCAQVSKTAITTASAKTCEYAKTASADHKCDQGASCDHGNIKTASVDGQCSHGAEKVTKTAALISKDIDE